MLKYQKIAQQIENQIQEEDLPQGAKLPNVTELVKKYNVSKNTILRTLKTLEEKGCIYQVQGSGIFVRRKRREGYITLLKNQGFSADLTYLDFDSKVISIDEITCPEEVAKNLHCTTADKVYMVKRVQHIQGQILCLEESYYKMSIVPFLNESIAEGSIFHYIEKGLRINIGFSDKYLSVVKTDKEIADYLEMEDGDPALLVEEVYYTSGGEPFDFSKNHYHYDRAKFFLQSQ